MRGEGSIPDSLLKISTGAVESSFRKLDEKSDAQVDSPCFVFILRYRTFASKAVSVFLKQNSVLLSNNPISVPKTVINWGK